MVSGCRRGPNGVRLQERSQWCQAAGEVPMVSGCRRGPNGVRLQERSQWCQAAGEVPMVSILRGFTVIIN